MKTLDVAYRDLPDEEGGVVPRHGPERHRSLRGARSALVILSFVGEPFISIQNNKNNTK